MKKSQPIKSSLISKSLVCQYPIFKDDILKYLTSFCDDKLYIQFVEKFFSYIAEDYSKFQDKKTFVGIASEVYSLFKKNQKLPCVEININDNNQTTITIFNHDMPFIVDSLLCLLKQHALEPSILLHPVIYTQRNEKGLLQNIDLDHEGSDAESVIYLLLDQALSEKDISIIKKSIIDLLNAISITCNNWKNFLAKLDEVKKEHDNKIQTFIHWLSQNNFTFLGYLHYNADYKVTEILGSRKSWREEDNQLDNIIQYSDYITNKDRKIVFGTVNTLSPIHRSRVISYVLFKNYDANGNYLGGHVFLGLYASGLQYQSVSRVPLIQDKLSWIINKSSFSNNGYNIKKLKLIIESLPRELLFEIETEELYCMSINILSAISTQKLKLFTHKDLSDQFLNIFIFLPVVRLIPRIQSKIIKYFRQITGLNLIGYYVKEIVDGYSYLRLTIGSNDTTLSILDFNKIEIELHKLSKLWEEDIVDCLSNTHDLTFDKNYIKSNIEIIPYSYREKYSIQSSIIDLQLVLKSLKQSSSIFKLIHIGDSQYVFKIYGYNLKLKLSSIIPIIESLGFEAIEEDKFDFIKDDQHVQLSILNLAGNKIADNIMDDISTKIEEAFEKMYNNLLPIDSLCKLIILSGLSAREVMILQAITCYMRQVGYFYSVEDMHNILVKHYIFARNLIAIFNSKFSFEKDHILPLQELYVEIENYLVQVSISTEDKVLRNILGVFNAIVRTNYFQTCDHLIKDYISFKIDSSKVPDMPLPKPLFEIYVYSRNFEGLHLRGGKVARGGLRWSDRAADYRTEVLGLMKAQMTKNTVIVPVGSKGGFFVKKDLLSLSIDERMNEVVASYKNYLRGLLDITDNVVNGKIVSPKQTKCLDGEDPYLVVAADKGTASFSDYANSISREYQFWLDDAFASGGSDGYDHKKMGITAKGGWIAVQRHFLEKGIDIQKDSITVIGIGDMSGDVFGNAMLLSDKIKLVGAFNHLHIFIDPSPNSLKSFEERRRLFNIAGSKWTDYNPQILSNGGRIFSRAAKSLTLTDEIKDLLQLSINQISPEDLIKSLLKSRVDLIWNGGIGTYIKSEKESHADIGDKSNDNLRVNAKEVKAKVIGEGGNLGVSQLGRIEFSQYGGRINTDFIDNSAGVGCSDTEVNIKIALGAAVKSNKISLEERNILLKKMTDTVAQKVLQSNIDQTLAITIFEQSKCFTLEMFSKLITFLEDHHGLNREVEFLPSPDELYERHSKGDKLTRPELCILLSYSKISVFNQLQETNFANDPYLIQYLIDYFPEEMHGKFKEEILSHQLRREIINTILTNRIINQLTGATVNLIQTQTGSNIIDIMKYYIVISEVFDVNRIWLEIEKLPHTVDIEIKIDMFTEVNKLIRRGVSWIIMNCKRHKTLSDLVDEYKDNVKDIPNRISNFLYGSVKEKYNKRYQNYINNNVDSQLSQKVATFDCAISIFDILAITQDTRLSSDIVMQNYFLIGDELYLDFLRKKSDELVDNAYWHRLALQSIKDDLYDKQRRAIKMFVTSNTYGLSIKKWIHGHQQLLQGYFNLIKNIKDSNNIDISMIILANKKFENFLKNMY